MSTSFPKHGVTWRGAEAQNKLRQLSSLVDDARDLVLAASKDGSKADCAHVIGLAIEVLFTVSEAFDIDEEIRIRIKNLIEMWVDPKGSVNLDKILVKTLKEIDRLSFVLKNMI